MKPVIVRFLEKISVSAINFYEGTACWEWISSKNTQGYGQFRLNGKLPVAHRVAYELFRGDIPQELQLDHLCRNPCCVNPFHLEAVTCKENINRGLTGHGIHAKGESHYNSKKTHCKNGHEFTPENTIYRKKESGRMCRICYNLLHVKYRREKRYLT